MCQCKTQEGYPKNKQETVQFWKYNNGKQGKQQEIKLNHDLFGQQTGLTLYKYNLECTFTIN